MRRLIAFLLILATSPAYATFGAASAWDVRTTGVDTNGGAFDSGVGSPGTDESQGSGTAITVTLTGTTTGTGSPVFSATTHGPGNFVHIASGSGCTTGWFEVLSQSSGTATFDHAMGVATNVCVGTIGGSLLTIQQANTNAVSANTIYIQSGTYTFTTVMTLTQAIESFIGYNTTHTDNGTKPLITTATNSTNLLSTGALNSGRSLFQNLSFSNTASVRASGISEPSADGTAQFWIFNDDIFDGFVSAIDNGNGTPDDVNFVTINRTEIKNSTTAFDAHNVNTGTFMFNINGSYFHNNGTDIITSTGATSLSINDTIFANSTGSGGTDVNFSGALLWVTNCTFANNTNQTALGPSSSQLSFMLTNNIFYGNAKAIAFSSLTNQVSASALSSRNNAFGNNTAGNSNWPGNIGDITLSANPFTASGSGDYSLNSTAGGGASLKGAAYPGTFGTTTTSHLDVGAVQSAGGGGGAAGNFGVSN